MIKKGFVLSLLITIVVYFAYHDKYDIQSAYSMNPLWIEGEAAIVLDEKTGETLFAKNENKKLYPASLTKLLTALVVLEKADLDERVTVGDEVYLQSDDEVRVGLFEGQVLTVEDLLGAMLMQSGNDAARTLAIYTAHKEKGTDYSALKSIQYFAQLMNVKAIELGAAHSHFVNPHGLHDPNHYSTAKDLAEIALAVKKEKSLTELLAQTAYSSNTHTYQNRNQLLHMNSPYYYKSATGLKTGFTDQAGYCLVSSAEEKDQSLITVVLQSGKERVWEDAIALLDFGFENLTP
ncbi:D-alanyl-D-alanine carboxypeptidase family protein [Bacillus sp. SD088]|uniref:D-alanyl-D-alanine carboxypeptidase family protein n=1 Tax=Bacillus sp. SD088 TaxID=2782012 RepID=UPI001A979233|nr:D-alanyl-D-alanine carboxypeptidase family protein [Bacillus sp. SD088]MBO0992504.1 D-alanyl-D-alanine carboxypeptidase [Bacillus sp. SD088]